MSNTSAVAGEEQQERERMLGKWQTYSTDMSPGDYRRAVRDNHRLVRKFVKSYSSETLASVGVPQAGITFLGAAAGLAVDGDARLHLNSSKTLALQFDDVIDSDRALFLTIKKRW
jgi:hypothetical protein